MTEEITPVPGPYFRFTDETTWVTVAQAAGLYITNEETGIEELQAYTADRAIDVIGTLYNDDGVYDEDGEQVTAPTPMVGWHVNYLGEPPAGWDAYEVTPEPPERKWLGYKNVC